MSLDLDVESEFQKQQAKKGIGIAFSFVGGFLMLIGILFGFLFVPGLFGLAIGGGVFFLISVTFLRSTRDISIFDKPEITKKKIAQNLGLSCKNCGRIVPGDANICPYCGTSNPIFIKKQELPQNPTTRYQPTNLPEPNRPVMNPHPKIIDTPEICPSCGTKLDEGVKFCPYCGINL